MSDRYTGPLSAEQALNGMHECLANARELLVEAEMLIAAERFPRAVALLVIAWEELGKLPMLAGSPRYPDDPGVWKKRFWKRFRDHREKLFLQHQVFPVSGSDNDDEAGMAEFAEVARSRERMLYTDFNEGRFARPSSIDGVGHVADDLLRWLRQALHFHERMVSRLTIDRMETIARLTPTIIEVMRDALKEATGREEIPTVEVVRFLKEAGFDVGKPTRDANVEDNA